MLYSEKVDAQAQAQTQTHTHTHTHTFNGPLSGSTQVSRYQNDKTNLDFTEARDSEWQWHQLGHMQVCTSLQTDNHASTPLLSFFTGRMPFLPQNQQRQSTEDKSTEGFTVHISKSSNTESVQCIHRLNCCRQVQRSTVQQRAATRKYEPKLTTLRTRQEQ